MAQSGITFWLVISCFEYYFITFYDISQTLMLQQPCLTEQLIQIDSTHRLAEQKARETRRKQNKNHMF